MKYILVLLIVGIIFLSGCTEQEIEEAPEAECKMPMDCEGRMHIQCVGFWQCLDGKCNWQCSGEHLELPGKEQKEGLTG